MNNHDLSQGIESAEVWGDRETEYTGLERRYQRYPVSNFTCDVSNGYRVLEGKVENVSRSGFKMSQVNSESTLEDFLYKAVVAGDDNYYKMMARPCWQAEGNKGLEIGFKILDVSWEWHEMILQAEENADR